MLCFPERKLLEGYCKQDDMIPRWKQGSIQRLHSAPVNDDRNSMGQTTLWLL
jgi:hypothetical protein